MLPVTLTKEHTLKQIIQRLTPRLDHSVPDVRQRRNKAKVKAFLKAVEAEEAAIRSRLLQK